MIGEYGIDQVDIYSQTDPPVELNTLSQPVESLLGQLAYASPMAQSCDISRPSTLLGSRLPHLLVLPPSHQHRGLPERSTIEIADYIGKAACGEARISESDVHQSHQSLWIESCHRAGGPPALPLSHRANEPPFEVSSAVP